MHTRKKISYDVIHSRAHTFELQTRIFKLQILSMTGLLDIQIVFCQIIKHSLKMLNSQFEMGQPCRVLIHTFAMRSSQGLAR